VPECQGSRCQGAGCQVARMPECQDAALQGWRRSTALRSPGQSDLEVARAAQQPVILEAAFAAAVRHRRDVIRLPSRPFGAPALPRGAIGPRRLRARPFAVRPGDVEAAQSADPFVALLHLLPDVPGAAPDLPLMHARVAAERPPRRLNRAAAPAAYRLPRLVPIRNAPLVRCYRPRPPCAHGAGYRLTGFRGSGTNL
jgi:hypothetical protein